MSFSQSFPVTAKLTREKDVASKEVAIAEAEVRDLVRILIADVESAFYSVRALDEQLGVNRHTDAGALTLLYQDDVASLQVLHDGAWVLVEPSAGALVVNLGDMLQVWSNDRYEAPLHREKLRLLGLKPEQIAAARRAQGR